MTTNEMRNFLRSKILADDDVVLRREAGDEKDRTCDFLWKCFRLFDSRGKEIDLNRDIFIEK